MHSINVYGRLVKKNTIFSPPPSNDCLKLYKVIRRGKPKTNKSSLLSLRPQCPCLQAYLKSRLVRLIAGGNGIATSPLLIRTTKDDRRQSERRTGEKPHRFIILQLFPAALPPYGLSLLGYLHFRPGRIEESNGKET